MNTFKIVFKKAKGGRPLNGIDISEISFNGEPLRDIERVVFDCRAPEKATLRIERFNQEVMEIADLKQVHIEGPVQVEIFTEEKEKGAG